MPQPDRRMAPSHRPRHAAGGPSHALVFATSLGSTDTAQHRRPQSLADVVRPRSTPPAMAAPRPPAMVEPRRTGERGRHAAPANPTLPVRPLPAVRDAVVEGLPAAKRMAGAVRDWAL